MIKPTPLTLDLNSTIMLLLLAAVWGGSFFLGEIALREVPPLTITLHRVAWALPNTGLDCSLQRNFRSAFPKNLGSLSSNGCPQQHYSVLTDILGTDAD